MLRDQPVAIDLDHRQRQAERQHGAVLEGEIRKPRAEKNVGPDRDGLLVAHLRLDARWKLAEIGAYTFGAGEQLGETSAHAVRPKP